MTKKKSILAAASVALTISAAVYAADINPAKPAGPPVGAKATANAAPVPANAPGKGVVGKTEIPSTPDTPSAEASGAAKAASAPAPQATATPAAMGTGPKPGADKVAQRPANAAPAPAASVTQKPATTAVAPVAAPTPAPVGGPVAAVAPTIAPVAPPAVSVAPQPAGAVSPSADAAYYQEEGELTKKLRLAKLKLEILDTENKLHNGGTAPAQSASNIAVMAPPAPLMPAAPTDGPGAGTSTVSSLSVPQQVHDSPKPTPTNGLHYVSYLIVGSTAEAMINVNGSVNPVSRGSVLSDGWTVTDVLPTRLVLGKGRATKSIAIGE